MRETGSQVFDYTHPCRLPTNASNQNKFVPNYFEAPANPNVNRNNNNADPYTMLNYWRVRFARDGFHKDNKGTPYQNKNGPCTYAGLWYPNLYKQKGWNDQLGWVAPYMWISRKTIDNVANGLKPVVCSTGKGKCTYGYDYWKRVR